MGFLLLKLVNAVFDGAIADEFVDEDGFVLADTVGAVGSLVLGGGIPPGVEVDHRVGGGKVEAGTAGFKGDEKNGDVFALEFVDEIAAVFGGSGEEEVADAAGGELAFDERKHGGELGEKEDSAAFGEEGFEELEEVIKFG